MTQATSADPASRRTYDTSLIGNDKLLLGMIPGLLSFWLFGQTTLNIASVIAGDLGISTSVMNIAVSASALFAGIFMVVIGGSLIG